MPTLALVPVEPELFALMAAIRKQGHAIQTVKDDRLRLHHVASLDLVLALGGLGKAQLAVHTQYLLDRTPWQLAICAGSAGSLMDDVAIGDVVVGTETVEHDIRRRWPKLVPRFPGDEASLDRCRAYASGFGGFRLHLGGIASGDEQVVSAERRKACQRATGALAVAWEGAGGARACAFSGVPFLEVRGITDRADRWTPCAFWLNLWTAMRHVASVLAVLCGESVS